MGTAQVCVKMSEEKKKKKQETGNGFSHFIEL